MYSKEAFEEMIKDLTSDELLDLRQLLLKKIWYQDFMDCEAMRLLEGGHSIRLYEDEISPDDYQEWWEVDGVKVEEDSELQTHLERMWRGVQADIVEEVEVYTEPYPGNEFSKRIPYTDYRLK
jgi:hypothetical protein